MWNKGEYIDKGKKIKTEDMLKDEAIIFLKKINITKQNFWILLPGLAAL